MTRPLAILLIVLGLSATARSQDWSSFRGQNASGVAQRGRTATWWSAEDSKGLLWKAQVPGLGHSSPVVIGDRVFVTTAVSSAARIDYPHVVTGDMSPARDEVTHSWRVYCLDKRTGRTIWERTAHTGKPRSRRHPLNSFATPTPAADDKHLVVFFGSEGLYCFDLDGKLLWKQDVGVLRAGHYEDAELEWGVGSSPIIYKNTVILQCDVFDEPFVAAYDLDSGRRVWVARRDDRPSWSTPTLFRGAGRDELITAAPTHVRGYDPATGRELWRLRWGMDIHTSAPVTTEGMIYVSSGKGARSPIYALRPGGSGDLTPRDHDMPTRFVAWSRPTGGPITTTPLVYGDYLYAVSDLGILRCFDAKTGELKYEQRLGTSFFASPIAADGKLYLTGLDGDVLVVRAGPQYELLATNQLGEQLLATPAASDGLLIFRGERHLFCVKEDGTPAPEPGAFADVTAASGLAYRNYAPLFDPKIRPINALLANFVSPAAVGDFNNDGLDDIFFVSTRLGHRNALFKNRGGMRFESVTEGSGLADFNEEKAVATGALWFDYDNDGRLDLFIMRFGRSLLMRNNGDETFTDVTAASGLGRAHANTLAAVAFDYDNDGRLDLLTGGFLAEHLNLFDLKTTKVFPDMGSAAAIGGAKSLFRNNGDGSFTDVTARSGISGRGFTTALGHADYNNDNLQDFYVANDFGPDKLYRNNGNGTFTDVSRTATGADKRKGMNVDFADYNNDGHLDIYVTNITEPWLYECNMLWRNMGDGTFIDVSRETGTCDTGWGWGAKFLDFDNDGWLDIYAANGFISGGPEDYVAGLGRWEAANPEVDRSDAGSIMPIGDKTFAGYEPNRLFHNQGDENFREMKGGSGANSLRDGRGVALADFDHDGALDLLVSNSNQGPLLYRNLAGRKGNWIELRLTGRRSNRNAVGARVRLTAGSLTQIREVNCGNGYQSQSSFTLHFGLAGNAKVDRLEVRWPSGALQTLRGVSANQIISITEE